jgi:peptidyl-prolyl cis-trans isomerase A (cyclophilin A)
MRYCAIGLFLVLAACSPAPPPETKSAEAPKPPEKPPEVYRVLFETTKGNFTIEVTRAWAPRGADHFFGLVQAKFYDGVRFHRVIRGFVAQFGINGNPKKNAIWSTAGIPDDPVKGKNRKGTLTFAKLGPNSRTTQVFINLRDNLDLDKSGFPPFAKVVEGMDVVEKLYYSYGELAPRGSGPEPGRIETEGEAYLAARFPRLDRIEKATIIK